MDPREFAVWKFDTIELLIVGLPHREARVAICLLGRMNRITRLINPSQFWVGTMLGMDPSAVRRAIKDLVECGLLEVERGNRQRSNRYSFSIAKLNEFYDLRRDRLERARFSEKEEVSAQKRPDEEEAPSPEQEEAPSPDREEVSPKHFRGTIEGNHEDSASIEEVYQPDDLDSYPREDASGEESPQGERAGGGVRARRHAISDSLMRTRAMQPDPKASLDKLEQELARKGAA